MISIMNNIALTRTSGTVPATDFHSNNDRTIKTYTSACRSLNIRANQSIINALGSHDEVLRVIYAKLSSTDIKPLCSALKTDTNITALILEYNALDASDAALIADMLEDNETITELDLIGNDIGEEGIHTLLKQIKDRNTPLTLYVSSANGAPVAQEEIQLLNAYRRKNGLLPHELRVIVH